MDNDSELLRRYATIRDEAAFAELVKRRLALVYHAALRRVNGDATLAEEIAQSVFVSLAREAGTLHRHAMLSGWLYVATRHAAANVLRQDRRRQLREQAARFMHEIPTPAADAAWTQLRPELDAVMDELGDADRDAVLLRFFENRPYAEIGAVLKVSEDAARMRVERALDKLRLSLGRRGVTSTAAALGGVLAAQSALAAPSGLAAVVTATAMTAGATSASLGLVAFMSTNKIIATAAGALVLAAGGTAVFEHQANRRAEQTLVALGEEQAALRSQLSRERDRANALNEEKLAAERLSAELTARMQDIGQSARAGAAPISTRPRATPAVTSFTGKMDVLYANPEYVQLQLKVTAASLRTQYGAFYTDRQLAPDKIAQLEALMLERQQAMLDTYAVARAQGVSINDPLLSQLPDPVQGVVEEKLKALLGEADYASFQDYSRSPNGIARSTAGNLASNLYYTSTPLTAAQGRQLAQLIAANTAKPTGSGHVRTTPDPNWDAIYAGAGQILSPDQVATLRATNERNRLGRQLSDLSDKLLQEAAAKGNLGGG